MNQICEIKFGSHLYGTNTPESDLDYKGIYLPYSKEICLASYHKTINVHRPKAHGERNTKDDIDVEIFSLDRFLELLCDGQTVALDMLFAPKTAYVGSHPKWGKIMDLIYQDRHEFLSKNVNAFIGYARQQASKYGIKGSRMEAIKSTLALLDEIIDQGSNYSKLGDHWVKPQIEALIESSKGLVSLEKTPLISIVECKAPNGGSEPHLCVAGRKIPFHATAKYAHNIFSKAFEGYGARAHKAHLAGGADYKALSHAVRVNSEAIELLTTGHITFPRPDADLLLKIKTLQLPMEQVSEIIEQGLVDLVEAQKKSDLQDEPNREYAKTIVYEIYREIVKQDT